MEKISAITAISIFLISIFLYWRYLRYYSKKQVGERMYKQWNSKLYFWQGAIFIGTGATFLIMFILKWTGLLTF